MSTTGESLLKRALLELKEMRTQLKSLKQASSEPIAIVGLGCRFPGGADSPEHYWNLLREGRDTVVEVPPNRWNIEAYYDPDAEAPGKMNTRWGAFVNDLEQFDPGFFGLSIREAATMDPQQRMLLEVAWEALEDAGLSPDRLAGSQTGVFVGLCFSDYHRRLARPPARGGTGVAHSIAANRLSYFFDWKGPSLVVDTACSSSLIAVDLACDSLRHGGARMALAGGVNVLFSPDLTVTFSQAGMMARDGRCKTFDARGDGYVRGEGCGLVVLKRLSDALADGDRIQALIRGSAYNQDGRSNGLTAPSAQAQRLLIQNVLEKARVAPTQVGLIEAHGTGTPMGDPIEFEALRATYGAPRPNGQECAVSSVKTNLGHLEAAAGIAGLIKAVLCLQREAIPPHLHFRQLNPNISLEGTPFFIPTQLRPWPRSAAPRFASVSSFGFGGTNAHVLLEEAPAQGTRTEPAQPLHVLTLSAKSDKALRELALRHARHLEAYPQQAVGDVCYTTNVGRALFPHRLAVLASSSAEVKTRLEAFLREPGASGPIQGASAFVTSGVSAGEHRPRLAVLFTGQGSQYPGMARTLYETQPTFRRTLDRCAELLRPHLDKPLLSLLHPASGEDAALHQTGHAQPALFSVEYSLAELWRSWGLEPDAVLGHSVGEYVAACVAGCFSLEDGLKLIAERGRLMQQLPLNGEMVLVTADEATVKAALAPYAAVLSIAAINGPRNVVISGEKTAMAAVVARFEEDFIHTEPMRVSHAFHSTLMEPMLDAFERFASTIPFKAPRIPMFMNTTGEELAPGQRPDAAYWRRHARNAVRFQQGLESLHAKGYRHFLEMGPHDVLCQLGKKCLPKGAATWFPSLRRKEDDWQTLLDSAAKLYVAGLEPDWLRFTRDAGFRRLALPAYPFERRRCWPEPSELRPADGPEGRAG